MPESPPQHTGRPEGVRDFLSARLGDHKERRAIKRERTEPRVGEIDRDGCDPSAPDRYLRQEVRRLLGEVDSGTVGSID